MKNTKTLIIICMALCFATSCKKAVDMTLVQKTLFENADLRQIAVSGAWPVTIVFDSTRTYVELDYSAYLEPYIRVQAEGTKLEVGFTGRVYAEAGSVFHATIHTDKIESLEAKEASKVQSNGRFQGQKVEVSLSGAAQCNGLDFSGEACEIEMHDASLMTGFRFVGNTCSAHLEDASQFNGQIQSAQRLEAELESASRFVNKGGETSQANIKLKDGSFLNMAETQVENMHIELTSASESTVQVSSLLEGWAKTASTLYYKGHPLMQIECDESSSVVPF